MIVASIVFTAIGVRLTTQNVRVGGDEDEDDEGRGQENALARREAAKAKEAASKKMVLEKE